MLHKKSQGPVTLTAERRADGKRIERQTSSEGVVVNECVATVFVRTYGGEKGEVVLSISGAARDHFDVYLSKCREAGGKFVGDGWRFAAEVGHDVADKLLEDGFDVEESESTRGEPHLNEAIAYKFGISDRFEVLVDLTASGFVVVKEGGRELPCTLGEALLLDEGRSRFTGRAIARLRAIRLAAGFPNRGNALEADDDELFDEMPEPSTPVRTMPRVGRNAPCPCGSGNKYKKCCENSSLSGT